jgi:hypothetical protein
MKKKTLAGFSLVALAMLFIAVTVQAQSINSYRAHVPFDFVVGEENYEAGDYIIRFEQPGALATTLTVQNAKGRELQAAAVMRNGNTSKSDRSMLVFNRYGDNYVLRQIVSPGFGFWAPKSETATWVTISKKMRKKPETVSVALNR